MQHPGAKKVRPSDRKHTIHPKSIQSRLPIARKAAQKQETMAAEVPISPSQGPSSCPPQVGRDWRDMRGEQGCVSRETLLQGSTPSRDAPRAGCDEEETRSLVVGGDGGGEV
jgi:hypothetical protein